MATAVRRIKPTPPPLVLCREPIPVPPAIIPGLHDRPGRTPSICVLCREPILGIPARTADNMTLHTACLTRMRTR